MTEGIRLNMGAGEKTYHAPAPWINIDSRPAVEPDMVADVRRLTMYEDDTVDAIFAGHVLEHMPLDDVPIALAEWLRILKPAARICVVGPDVDKGAVLFEAGKITRERFAGLGIHANELAIAETRRLHPSIAADEDPTTSPAFHYWDCTGGQVAAHLDMAGFVDVVEVPMGVAPFDFPIYDRTMFDQFVVLARKP